MYQLLSLFLNAIKLLISVFFFFLLLFSLSLFFSPPFPKQSRTKGLGEHGLHVPTSLQTHFARELWSQ